MAQGKTAKDTPTEAIPVKGHKLWDFKPVWIGYCPPKQLGRVDDEGLPLVIPDTMGKERENFEALLDAFGAKGYEPHMEVEFRSGDAYLIFKREKA